MSIKIDMVGMLPSGTEVVSFSHREGALRYYNCVCFCGISFVRSTKLLRRGLKQGAEISCGCIRGNDPIHGLSRESIYWRYNNMISRCYNPNDEMYPNYGARGIQVCDRWLEPDHSGLLNFIEDMGYPPEGMTIDRKDVNGNYCPENCMWENKSNQGFNRRVGTKNTSGVTGVGWSTKAGKWRARITLNRNEIGLGYFDCFFQAVCARKSAELAYYPDKVAAYL